MIETGLVTEIETGNETDTENENAKGLESGMVGDIEMEEEEQIGGTAVPGMGEMEAGIGTVSGVGQVPLLGIATGGPHKVQFGHISGLCR